VVFETLGIGVGRGFADPDREEEGLDELVPLVGLLGDLATSLRELDLPPTRAANEALLLEPAQGTNNGDMGDAKNRLEVDHPDRPGFPAEAENRLDIILGKLALVLATNPLMVAGGGRRGAHFRHCPMKQSGTARGQPICP
jgi:hypothetical protein